MRFDKILILVDDNPLSKKAAMMGYELAADLDAKVVLAYIIDEALAMGDVDAGIFPDEAMRQKIKIAEKLLQKIHDESDSSVQAEMFVKPGEIATEIPKLTKQTGSKMIVIGAHHHTGLNRLIEGNPEESVLGISTVPVLVIPKT